MKGVNDKPGTPNYDLYKMALESTSKRLYPNYANQEWSNNVTWVKQDRELKKKVIDVLTEEERQVLIKQGLRHPEELKKLSLKIENNQLVIDNEMMPYELFSTMGKRKLQLI